MGAGKNQSSSQIKIGIEEPYQPPLKQLDRFSQFMVL